MIKEIIGYTTAITVLPKVDSGPDTNGHEYVDLGLPSGTLWATMNVGASSLTEYGNYYMYGMGSKTYDSTDTPYDGTEDPLDLSKDTARVVWGGDWHTPTKEQLQELLDNTTYIWVDNYNNTGVNGGTFTSLNGNVLFIPAAGTYTDSGTLYGNDWTAGIWGSSPFNNSWGNDPYDQSTTNKGCSLYFFDGFIEGSNSKRIGGYSVRPVIG